MLQITSKGNNRDHQNRWEISTTEKGSQSTLLQYRITACHILEDNIDVI